MWNTRFTICAALFLLLALAVDSRGGYSGGTGEPNDPFRISKVADWQELMTSEAHWGKHFILTTELDLTGVTVTPVGHETQNFTGSIDGSGYVIRDITIAMPDSDCVALFGSVGSGARIHHVGLEDVEVAGHGYVAALAGDNDGAISNCYSTGRVTGAYNVGGLVGYNINGRINNCYSTGSVTGDNGVGGLVGYNYGGSIHNCYATSRVTGSGGRVGGLAGHYYYGAITRSYFLRLDDGGGQDNGLGTALTDIQMRQQGSFIGWDFVGETSNGTCDFWQMANGEGYPVLSTLNGRIPAEPVGSGTVEDPYILTDANELGTVWYRPSAHYVLGACRRTLFFGKGVVTFFCGGGIMR